MTRDYLPQDAPPGYRLYDRYLGRNGTGTSQASELLFDVRLANELDEQATRGGAYCAIKNGLGELMHAGAAGW